MLLGSFVGNFTKVSRIPLLAEHFFEKSVQQPAERLPEALIAVAFAVHIDRGAESGAVGVEVVDELAPDFVRSGEIHRDRPHANSTAASVASG